MHACTVNASVHIQSGMWYVGAIQDNMCSATPASEVLQFVHKVTKIYNFASYQVY